MAGASLTLSASSFWAYASVPCGGAVPSSAFWMKAETGWSAVMFANSSARLKAAPQAGTLLPGSRLHGYMKTEKSGRQLLCP